MLYRGRATAHGVGPEFWRRLGEEFAAGRQWLERTVVLACAAVTGLVVVGFTLLDEAASHGFEQLRSAGPSGPWLMPGWAPALTVLLPWWTRRFAPGAKGSGIRQVVRAADDDLEPHQRSWLVSLRLSAHEIGLVSGGLLARLSLVAGLGGGLFSRLIVVSVRGLRAGRRRHRPGLRGHDR